LFLAGLGRVSVAYGTANQVKKDIAEKTSVIQDWRSKTLALQGNAYRPIAVGEMEELQGSIFRGLDAYHLNLLSFGVVSSGQEEGKAVEAIQFEMSFSGAWDSSVRFVQNFRVSSALVVVQNVKMEPDEKFGELKTSLKYKVYIK
jgi:hypothetical protein